MYANCSDGPAPVSEHLEQALRCRTRPEAVTGPSSPLLKSFGVLPTRLPSPVPHPKGGRRKADGVEQPHLELELRPAPTCSLFSHIYDSMVNQLSREFCCLV